MGEKIYGIDPNKKISPIMIRDAIVGVFLSSSQRRTRQKLKQCLLKIIERLGTYAKKFRNQKTVKQHIQQIMSLINKLED